MVEIHYFAAARAARGIPRETVETTDSLDTLLTTLSTQYSEATTGGLSLAEIFERCSFLVDGRTVLRKDASAVDLSTVGRIDVLPPFAGG